MIDIRTSMALILCFVVGPKLDAQHTPPRLGVVIVVDQMRADAINRMAGWYTGGLAELVRSGAVFRNAHQDQAITETAVGHATIATGVFPRRHGIVGNSWYDRNAGRAFYASEDSSVYTLEVPTEPGRSPAQLRATTVGDWLKAASPSSKVMAVALKDRAATFMGGRAADAAYWYLEDAGRYVTSSYYPADSLPWLSAFNAPERIGAYFAEGWTAAFPAETYFVAREDSFATEADGVHLTFPHRFSGNSTGPAPAYYRELRISPFADELTFELARVLVERDSLGVDTAPDLLFIGASAADYIGHSFGPLSKEAADYYLRLDLMLDEFMRFLDERIGQDRYFIVLTSDHGVLPLPEDLARRGLPATRVTRQDFQLHVQQAIIGALRDGGFTNTPNVRFANGLVLEFGADSVTKSQLSALRADIAQRLRSAPFVEDAYTLEELGQTGGERPYLELYRRQFPDDLAPDVAIRFSASALVAWGDVGTTHGSPYDYDTWIPLIVRGPQIPSGAYDRRVRSVDIAPTVARLLGVDSPEGLDGRVLEEIVRRP